ncbi:hypothetical protein Baya_2857 [Bagarius yarrelli]|uniref:Uncharacterized protein n=1 Tax=Bagarius yarrelli TaxID=175774 RepID=A0A556TQP8_BAGYA|nr:hypothetical protein Baya_2857 [Bagarius yarrelli]
MASRVWTLVVCVALWRNSFAHGAKNNYPRLRLSHKGADTAVAQAFPISQDFIKGQKKDSAQYGARKKKNMGIDF